MPAGHKNEEEIFHAMVAKPASERLAYLRAVCGEDSELFLHMEALLQAYETQDDFLEVSPAAGHVTLDSAPVVEGPGTVIGRYKLLEKIGEGGMAVVYMAGQEQPIRRKVALKIIKLGMDTRQVIARFEAERQALALMDHPNIAKVFDAGATETGRPYFVMELVTGVSITEYCDKNNLSTKDRLALFLQICNAVQHAHEKGVVHRDIKPSNVMVAHHDGKPVPKVIDFGIAKATNQRLTEKTLFTRYAHIIGTPAYMSPEQAELSDLGIDRRSDIYSLGVLLYELLTGTTPFSEEELRDASYLEMQRIIREQEPIKPSTKLGTLGETLTDIAKRRGCTPDLLARTIRGDLDWIVMKTLEKDRVRRYEGASGLALDIERHLAHRPVTAHAPSTAYRLRKFLRRNRLQVGVVLALAVVAGTVIISSLWNRHQLQLAEAEGARQVNDLAEARKLVQAGDLTAARQLLDLILESKHVGLDARILFRRIMANDANETPRITAIMDKHHRERVQYYTRQIEADPTDPNHYLRRAQQFKYLRDEDNVHADMSRYAAILGQGWFSRLRLGTPTVLKPVTTETFPHRLVFSVGRRDNGIVTASIAFGQKGRSTMKPFEIPMLAMSLFGFCLFTSLDTPVVLADFTFDTPRNVESTVPVLEAAHDSIDCFSYDGLEMYVDSDRPGGSGDWDLWVSARASVDDDWGPLQNLGVMVNSPNMEAGACISADGLTLYFGSTRSGGYGACDIYMTTRVTTDSPWGPAANVGPTINSASIDGTPWITQDDRELYFGSYRPGGCGYCDIYVTRRATASAAWAEPTNLGSVLNSAGSEHSVCLSPDGLVMLFTQPYATTMPRPGGYGGADIWMSRRASLSASWQAPLNLGPQVNGAGADVVPRFSFDASTLHYSQYFGGTWNNWQSAIIPIVDFNGDGKVNGEDLGILTDNWGKSESLCDIGPYAWGDGIVDAQDLAVLGEYMDVTGPVVAHSPSSNASEVARNVVLSWTPGDYAVTHDVYFGISFEDVSLADRVSPLGVLASPGQDANTYDPPGPLEFGQTYYWRIDAISAGDVEIYKGFVWSFTTESLAAPIENVAVMASSFLPDAPPENTINGSGLDGDDLHSINDEDMWLSTDDGPQPAWIEYEFDAVYKLHQMLVWNYNVMFEDVVGYGLKHVTIEYSDDGATWTVLDDFEFARSSGEPTSANTVIDFDGAAAKHVRLTIQSNWGGFKPQYGLSEVRFLCIPAQATDPQPADGQTDVSPDTELTWSAGREAVVHEVYLDTDEAAVAEGIALADVVAESRYQPEPLTLGRTYYWKINEVNEGEAVSVWESDLWSFSTQAYLVVDDFESYTNDSPHRVFQTWTDGIGFSADDSFPQGHQGNGTGAVVGYDPALGNIMEHTIVRSGGQSMPVAYDNTASPFYSEIERTFDKPQNWTVNGADTLRVCFHGRARAFLERPDGSIVMSGGGTDIYEAADEFRFASKELTGDGTVVARVESIVNTHEWAKCGVMIRESLDPGSRFAGVYATPERGVRFQARRLNAGLATSDSSVASAEQMAMTTPVWVKLERSGNSFRGYYSSDGVQWMAMSWNPQTINMVDAVYVGLAVTSHNATAMTTAEFSGVATTGNVTGDWQVEAIGIDQPGNSPASFYVALEDNAGNVKLIRHGDPEATLLDSWQEWLIGLDEFASAGVDVGLVKKMYLGVGHRDDPTSTGVGTIFIDDIAFGHPLGSP
ncbi:MAG: protein kinase [Sedimentisphaerales bacterium]|nr:protein kinase [Sedimentisphaerales bacterium]